MAAPPTSLSPSLDSTLQPILLLSTHHPSSSSLSLRRPFHFLSLRRPLSLPFRLLRAFSSPSPPPPTADSCLEDPPRAGPFLGPGDLESRQTLENFQYTHEFDHGSLRIRPMEHVELDPAVQLLAESFAESLWVPSRYVIFLALLVKQYLLERTNLVPHAALLVGIYRARDGDEEQLACTAEVSFNALGANAAPPTPVPPREFPYICNMTVKKPLRRRGIGWHLLKACEELICQMTVLKKVYLHCRVIDSGPFSMYSKAGYKIVKTDSILIWLTLQRRKYLMSKELSVSNGCQPDIPGVDDHPA